MRSLAIIPARSGSKGLPNKNIMDLDGKPLMAYSIEAALKSDVFDEVMVSTDSEEYRDIALRFGAKVPFLRSKEMSGDTVTTWDSVREVLSCYKRMGIEFDVFCVLQPTSPLRTEDDIRNAYRILTKKAKVGVVSVCEVEHSPMWCNTIPKDGSLEGFISKDHMTRRQSFDKYYRLNGAIYFMYTDEFLKDEYFYRDGCYAYFMSERNSIDIDTEMDYLYCNLLIKDIDTKNSSII